MTTSAHSDQAKLEKRFTMISFHQAVAHLDPIAGDESLNGYNNALSLRLGNMEVIRQARHSKRRICVALRVDHIMQMEDHAEENQPSAGRHFLGIVVIASPVARPRGANPIVGLVPGNGLAPGDGEDSETESSTNEGRLNLVALALDPSCVSEDAIKLLEYGLDCATMRYPNTRTITALDLQGQPWGIPIRTERRMAGRRVRLLEILEGPEAEGSVGIRNHLGQANRQPLGQRT